MLSYKETCIPIANPPNSAQLEGTPYHSPQVTSESMQYCRNAARDRQTDTQMAVPNIDFASATHHEKCNYYFHLLVVFPGEPGSDGSPSITSPPPALEEKHRN